MTFLNDLNLLSMVATVIALAVCGCVLFLDGRDWLNRRKSNGEFDGVKQCVYLCFLSLACVVGAVDAFSPSANIPHKTVTGEYRIIYKVNGRHSTTYFICVIDCTRTGGYTLALDEDAQLALENVPARGRYEFEYLTHPSGNAFTGVWLRVVGIRAAETGAQLYYVDLARHWGRVLLYVADFLLLAVTGVLCVVLERSEKKGDKEDEGDDPEAVPEGRLIIGLELSSGGGEHSSE
jgi:hypothetical protein